MDRHKQGFVDIWTPAHVIGGALTRYVGLSPGVAAAVWVAFEFLENTIAEHPEVKDVIPTSGAESLENVVGDIAANALGYAALNWYIKRAK